MKIFVDSIRDLKDYDNEDLWIEYPLLQHLIDNKR